jgi:hypothetical protein
MISGWNFFKLHKALDFHFHTDAYDIFKYEGKINVSPEKFGVRQDRFRFEYYGGKFFNREKAAQFCIANFVRGNRQFVYTTFEDSEAEYFQWKKVQESITKMFSDDIQKIIFRADGADIFNLTPSGKQPPLLQMMKAKFINLETAIIIHKERYKFLTKWSDLSYNDPYVGELLLTFKKYIPFVKYDKEKINLTLQELKF